MLDLVLTEAEVCAYCGSTKGGCAILIRPIETSENWLSKISEQNFIDEYLERPRRPATYVFYKAICNKKKSKK